jgi:2-polyprenyl-3-methyl-5-hydroxy-6-metoxy-1,4-benzoquinol methylase
MSNQSAAETSTETIRAEFSRCYICNSGQFKILHRYHATGLVKCRNCGFVFSKWIPTLESLVAFYNKYPEYHHWNEITSLRYRRIIEGFEKYRQTNNLIEVGSGEGFFLDEAKASNWNVYGTEFIERFIDRCRQRGIVMHQGKLDVSNYKEQSMDIIIWIEVIEHINDPAEELKKFKALLRPGGIVYVTTPNFNSISRMVLREKLNLISYPNHLAYYTPSTLQYLFEHNGFRKVKIQTTGVSPGRIIAALKKGDNDEHDTPTIETQQIDEPLRERIESNAFLKTARDLANKILTITKTGDALKGIFQKVS